MSQPPVPDGEIKVTALYVFNELEKHTKECAARWWTVMLFVIGNLVALIGGLATIITMLASRGHG